MLKQKGWHKIYYPEALHLKPDRTFIKLIRFLAAFDDSTKS